MDYDRFSWFAKQDNIKKELEQHKDDEVILDDNGLPVFSCCLNVKNKED